MRAPTIVLAALCALACAPKDREIRLERLAAERRALEKTFDHLEDRLVVSQARVRFWTEMRERHESVSAIACAVQDEHADEMALHALPPARSTLAHARVAAAPAALVPQRVPASSGAGSAGGGMSGGAD